MFNHGINEGDNIMFNKTRYDSMELNSFLIVWSAHIVVSLALNVRYNENLLMFYYEMIDKEGIIMC